MRELHANVVGVVYHMQGRVRHIGIRHREEGKGENGFLFFYLMHCGVTVGHTRGIFKVGAEDLWMGNDTMWWNLMLWYSRVRESGSDN